MGERTRACPTKSNPPPPASCLTRKSWSKLQQSSLLRTILAAVVTLLAGCKAEREATVRGNTMGTTWHLTYVKPANPPPTAPSELVQSRLDEMESIFSDWRPETVVSKFNASRSTDWQAVPKELADAVFFAQQLSRETQGAYDVTAAPIIDLWGFGARGRVGAPPSDAAIAEVKALYGWQKLEVRQDPPMLRKLHADLRINVSAMVEGYAVDDIVQRLRTQGISNFLLDVGGEIYASGVKADGSAWQVGVQRPDADQSAVVGSMPLRNKALATSGTYNQFFEYEGKRYAHLLDARTGRPVEHSAVSVSVTTDTCFAADGWASALLIVGPDEGGRLAGKHGISAMILTETPHSR
jgi:thiamine biosynthesis lipoprotein